MKVRGWDIDQFAHLEDVAGGGLGDHLNVIVAPNETGKTTLHHFVRWILLGFPSKNSTVLRRYRPDKADIGGRLRIDHHGTDLVLERHLNTTATPSIRLADGRPAGLVAADLTGTVTLGMYESVFAVGLDELHGLRSMDPDAVRAEIYAAGLVGNGRSASKALDDIDRRLAHLLGPRSGFLRQLEHDMVRAKAELRSARDASNHVGSLQSRVDNAEAAVCRVDDEIAQCRAEQTWFAQLGAVWPDWSEAAEARDERDALPDLDLGPDPIGRLDALSNRFDELDTRRIAIGRALDRARTASAGLRDDPEALTLADALTRAESAIERERTLVDVAARSAAELEAERRAVESGLGRDLGAGWTIDRVRTLGIGVADVGRIERAADAAIATESDHRTASRVADDARRATEMLARPPDAATSIEAATDQCSESDLSELSGLIGLLEEHTASPRAGSATPRRGGIRPGVLGVIAVAAALALAAVGALTAAVAVLVIGGIATAASVLAGAAAERRDHGSSGPAPDHDAISRRATTLALEHGFDRLPSRATIDERIRSGRTRDAAQAWHRAEEQRLAADAIRTAELAAAARRVRDDSANTWRAVLASLGLPPDLDPRDATRTAARLSAATSDIARLDSDADAVRRVRAEIAVQIEAQAEVLLIAGVPLDASLADRAEAIALTRRRIDAARIAVADRKRLDVEIDQFTHDLDEATRLRNDARAAVVDHLAAAGSDDPQSYRRLAAAVARRTELSALIADADQLVRITFAADAETAIKELDRGRVAEWADGVNRTAAALVRLQAEQRNTHDEAAEARRCLRDLEVSADVVTASMRVDGLSSELAVAAEEWLELMLARRAIERVLDQFERERQPDVVRYASVAFTRITDGRWSNVIVAEDRLEVVDDRGRRLTDDHLSRGAIEQLYLCMRFGLAVDRARAGTELPMLLDDVFVNADPRRQERLAAELGCVADEVQVVMFTASEATADLLRRARPDTTIIGLT